MKWVEIAWQSIKDTTDIRDHWAQTGLFADTTILY